MISYVEQIRLIIYFLIFGYFIGCTYDTLKFFINKINIVFHYVLESVYWVIILVIAYHYIIKVQKGFINIYTIIFYILGLLFYYVVFRKWHFNTLKNIANYFNKFIKKILKEMFFSDEIIKGLKKLKKIKKVNKKT